MLISGREPVASPGSEGRQSTCEREKKRFVVQCDLQALLFYITAVRDLPDDGHIELGIVFLDVADSVLSAEFRDHGRHLLGICDTDGIELGLAPLASIWIDGFWSTFLYHWVAEPCTGNR